MIVAEHSEQGAFFELRELFDSSPRERIPKIAVAADGSILAFTRSCGWLRRSEDGGASWGPIQELDSSGSNVLVDGNTGDILLVLPSQAALWRSRDHGETWAREEVLVRPNAMGHGTPGNSPAGGNCSEGGIVLQHGAQLWLQCRARQGSPGRDEPEGRAPVQHARQSRRYARSYDGLGEL